MPLTTSFVNGRINEQELYDLAWEARVMQQIKDSLVTALGYQSWSKLVKAHPHVTREMQLAQWFDIFKVSTFLTSINIVALVLPIL